MISLTKVQAKKLLVKLQYKIKLLAKQYVDCSEEQQLPIIFEQLQNFKKLKKILEQYIDLKEEQQLKNSLQRDFIKLGKILKIVELKSKEEIEIYKQAEKELNEIIKR